MSNPRLDFISKVVKSDYCEKVRPRTDASNRVGLNLALDKGYYL